MFFISFSHKYLLNNEILMSEEIEVIKLYEALTGRTVVSKNTDLQKTYQYRYAAKFMKNMKGIPWKTVKKIVYYAVEYARENKGKNISIWTRGLWILTKSNIVDIACKKAKEEDQQRNVDLDKVIKSKEFAQKCNYEFEKSEKGGFPNIVIWYDSGKISLTYLAMSESCKKALVTLDDTDKRMLPDQKEIIRRRIRCLIDTEHCKKLKNILGNDYIKIGGKKIAQRTKTI